MTANTCQCEHCLEIIKQQKRMEKLQKKKAEAPPSTLSLAHAHG